MKKDQILFKFQDKIPFLKAKLKDSEVKVIIIEILDLEHIFKKKKKCLRFIFLNNSILLKF